MLKRKVCFLLILILILIIPFLGGCKWKKRKRTVKKKENVVFRDVELENWEAELNKKPYIINTKRLKNPFIFFDFYRRITSAKSGKISPLTLVGIIKKNNKKFALLQDNTKRGFIVKEHSRIGNAIVLKIGNNYIILEVTRKNIFGQIIKVKQKLVLGKEKI